MAAPAHTPAPWRIETVKLMSGFEERILGPNNRMIGTICRSGTGTVAVKRGATTWLRFGLVQTEEDIANANLSIEAPELLASLGELHEAVGRFGWVRSDPRPSERARRADIMNRARAAIAKAMGNPS